MEPNSQSAKRRIATGVLSVALAVASGSMGSVLVQPGPAKSSDDNLQKIERRLEAIEENQKQIRIDLINLTRDQEKTQTDMRRQFIAVDERFYRLERKK